ncbi:MAG: ABC1 kinase family protein [Pseudobdellovibrionaceae bacterium]
MKIVSASRQIGRTLKNASRLRVIVSVFVRHGFYNIAERIKLGQFLLERLNPSADEEKYTIAERIRMSFEELGPTFVKLGQLLAARPDLVPDDFVQEFSKLHDKVNPLPFETIAKVLKEEFGSRLEEQFQSFDPNPLGSASIAQVHKAVLKNGDSVVVKVQRPGILQTINEDLNVLYFLAELLEKYVEETVPFNPVGIVDEYFKTLDLETNFVVEANNIRRFSQNFAGEPKIVIPKVYMDLTTERVLTMEALDGIPLSSSAALKQPGVDSEEIIRLGLKAYLKMVFSDGLFHGDLHAGNFFIFPDNRIGLIDFGVVGRLNNRTQSSIANMLFALSREDYERLAHEYIDLAPFDERVNVDLFARELRDLVAPYFGLTMKNVNLGKLLLKSSSIAARHHIQVPTELMLYFKSLVSVEGLGNKIQKDFDFLQHSLQFASELIKTQYEPGRVMQDLNQLARESRSFINSLPRQLNFLLRKVNSPQHTFKLKLNDIQDLKKAVTTSFNLLFLGIIMGSLLLSASYIYVHDQQHLVQGSIPAASLIGYLAAGFLGVIAFFNYIKK